MTNFKIRIAPLITLCKQEWSVITICQQVIEFYRELCKFDTVYKTVLMVSPKKGRFSPIDVAAEKAAYLLADQLLVAKAHEIRKMDGVTNPDYEFIMDRSLLSFGLETHRNEKIWTVLNFSFNNQNSVNSKVGFIMSHDDAFSTLDRCMAFLESANRAFLVNFSVIKISERELGRESMKYLAPLGWISYFANDSEYSIPDDLEGMEYQYTDRGKYIVLTPENPISNNELPQAYKDRLITLMQQLAERVPDYKRVSRWGQNL